MNIFDLFIPSRAKRKLDAMETFPVRWRSLHWEHTLARGQGEGQLFITKEEANAFKVALQEATKLLRDSNRDIQ